MMLHKSEGFLFLFECIGSPIGLVYWHFWNDWGQRCSSRAQDCLNAACRIWWTEIVGVFWLSDVCVHWVQPLFCWDVPKFCPVTSFADEFLEAKSQRQAQQWLDGLMNSRLLLYFCRWRCFYWLHRTAMNWGGVWNTLGTAASSAKSEPVYSARITSFWVQSAFINSKIHREQEIYKQMWVNIAEVCLICWLLLHLKGAQSEISGIWTRQSQ